MSIVTITDAVVGAANLKGLELLFEYTKFHIGLYLTLASGLVTVASIKREAGFALATNRARLFSAVAFILIAGLAGGVIASSITQCYGYVTPDQGIRCQSVQEFLALPLGPWNINLFSGRVWTWIEHTAFWIGLLFAAFSFKPHPTAIVPNATTHAG